VTFGLAARNRQHVLSDGNSDEFIAAYRVIASGVIVKAFDGRGRNAMAGDTLDWLSEAQAKHLLSHKLVERIDADV
jgi:hypothetical protein